MNDLGKERSNRAMTKPAIAMTALLVAVTGCTSVDDGDDTILRLVSAWPKDSVQNIPVWMLEEEIEEKTNGRISLEFTGGPEVMSPNSLAEGVQNGVIDMANTATSYYSTLLPEGEVLNYTHYSPSEEIEEDRLDYLNQIHNEDLNAQVLGRSATGSYAIYTTFDVEDTSSFDGKVMRGTVTYAGIAEGLGAEVTNIPLGDVYDALDRGIVEGFFLPYVMFTDWGLHEVVQCKVEPYYWQLNNVFLANLDRWNGLPEKDRTAIQEAVNEVTVEYQDRAEAEVSREEELLEEAGGRVCEMADGDEFRDMVDQVGWEAFSETVDDPSRLANLESDLRN